MSLESNIADLVSASTRLTQAVNITRAEVDSKQASAAQAATDIVAVKDAVVTAAGQAATSASQAATSLSTTVSDYAAQKVTKGIAAIQTSAEQELADQLHRRDPARHPFRGAKPSLVLDFVRQECHRNNSDGVLEQVPMIPFMTFTRGSTATFTGPDGYLKTAAVNQPRYEYDPVTGECLGLLVEEQRTNLWSYSRFAGGTGTQWVPEGNVVISPADILSPDGSQTAVKLTSVGSDFTRVTRAASLTGGAVYTITVVIKKGTSSHAHMTVEKVGTATSRIYVDMLTNACSVVPGSMTSITAAATVIKDGWLSVVITFTPPTSDAYDWFVGPANTAGASSTSGDSLYFYSVQLELGAFPTSYIPTPATFTSRASTKTYFDSTGVMRTAAINEAVTDYGYVDGRWVSKGLSLEPQATNVAKNSAGNGTYGYGADSTTTTELVSVSGVSLTRFVSSAGAYRRINWLGSPLGTGSVAFSLYVKKGTGAVIIGCAPWEGSTGNASTVTLDLALGGATVAKGEHATASCVVTDCGGLWRVAISLTYLSGHYTMGTFFFTTSTTDITLGGLQAETGPVATSYIPTTTAQVTRAADVSTSSQVTRIYDMLLGTNTPNLCPIDGGVLCVRTGKFLHSSWRVLAQIDDGLSNSARIMLDGSLSNKTPRMYTNLSGATGGMSVTAGATLSSLGPLCCAGRYNRFNTAMGYNGMPIASAVNSTAKASPLTRICVGSIGDGYQVNGTIRSLTYFPRQLSDADLQALTILEN